MTQAFPRSQRLHRQEEYGRVLRTKAITNKWFALYVESNAVVSKRLGIVASKRIMARAVDRNRVKRAIREVFRQSTSNIDALDVVVRVRCCPAKGEIKDFRQSLSCLLMKVRMKKNDTSAAFPCQELSISN